jgi:Xaa-Pro aminopeptidase 2
MLVVVTGLVLLMVHRSLLLNINDANSCRILPTQKNTSTILDDLRREMRARNISVYAVFADDEHGSEYTQPYDKRRDWLTGFRGSAGTAVVSLTKAALWTDSRYFTQAEEQLDCANWLLMRTGTSGVSNLIDWFVAEAAKESTLVRNKQEKTHSNRFH